MKYRNVGKAGIKVSEIALGSWMTDLKESSEEDVAKEVVKLAYENGINFFDCADAYSGGAAERFFGEVLKEFPRKDLVISSKVYFPTGDGVNDRGLSRKHIMENCEQSLKNMNLDYLDLYYCHRYDENTDLEETLRAMSDLVAQGKVLYYGVSEEWGSARIEEAQKIIDKRGLYPITVIQPQYNMVDRYIEHEIMGTCRKYGIGITSFSPLSQGLLTGKYKKGQPYPEGSRATHQADKQINNLLICSDTKRTDEHCDRNLSGSVYTNIKNVIGIGLIFQPCTTVRNNGARIEFLTNLIMRNSVVDTRGTNQLADDNTFCAIDYECTGLSHKRQIAHEDLMFVDFIILFVVQTNLYLQRCCISSISLLAFRNRVFYIVLAQSKIYELQT